MSWRLRQRHFEQRRGKALAVHVEFGRAGDAAESVAQHELQRRQLRQLVTFDLAADDVGDVLTR
jgi:hypothetical protein